MNDAAVSVLDAAPTRDGIEKFKNYIDGEWVPGRMGEYFDDVNPADTSDILGQFPASSATDAEQAVRAAAAACASWRKTSVTARARILNGAASYLETHVDRCAEELTREQGKALN